jgi:hypothetical protein
MADSDVSISDHIEQLVAEEHRLYGLGELEEGLTPAQHTRLGEVRVELDRLYDLLQQRRALRSAGQDPSEAHERDAGTVENYLQ